MEVDGGMEGKGDLRIYNRSSAYVEASMFRYFVVAALFCLCCFVVALLFRWGFVASHWMGNGHTEMFFPCFFPVSLRVSSCCPWRPTSLKAWVWVWRERENLQSRIMLRCFRGWSVGWAERLQNNWAWPRVLIDGSQRTPYIDGSYTHTITHSVLRVWSLWFKNKIPTKPEKISEGSPVWLQGLRFEV